MNSQTYLAAKQQITVNDIKRRPIGAPTPQSVDAPKKTRTYRALPPMPSKRTYWQMLQLPILLAAGALGGFFAETLAVGLSMLVIYAIIAFVRRIPSRITFTLALLLLSAISIMLLVKPSQILISNFSTYAFVLLLIGVITLGRETKMPKRTRRKYRR